MKGSVWECAVGTFVRCGPGYNKTPEGKWTCGNGYNGTARNRCELSETWIDRSCRGFCSLSHDVPMWETLDMSSTRTRGLQTALLQQPPAARVFKARGVGSISSEGP